MKDDILDDDMSLGFDPDAKLVELTAFSFEHEAYLCKAALEAEGIKCALTHTNMSQVLAGAMLSLGGIKMIVREADLEQAKLILETINKNHKENIDDDFREADHDDILYQKALREGDIQYPKWLWLFVVLIIAIMIYQMTRFSEY